MGTVSGSYTEWYTVSSTPVLCIEGRAHISMVNPQNLVLNWHAVARNSAGEMTLLSRYLSGGGKRRGSSRKDTPATGKANAGMW